MSRLWNRVRSRRIAARRAEAIERALRMSQTSIGHETDVPGPTKSMP